MTVEFARIGALEAEDRLLLVAYCENRSGDAVVYSCAREELRRQRLDDAPLLRAGVLRLVDQHMMDAAVELVEYPRRRIAAFQQLLRLHDQIVVIERAARPFGSCIFGPHRIGDGEGRFGKRRRMRRAPPLLDSEQFALQPVHCGEQVGSSIRELLCGQLFAWFASLCQEHRTISFIHRTSGLHFEGSVQFSRKCLIGL